MTDTHKSNLAGDDDRGEQQEETRFPLIYAQEVAENILEQLRPHCIRAEIAGSIRRRKETVKDIEIVAIPTPYEVGLFQTGIATIVDQWQIVKGHLGPKCKYTQRMLPQGIKIDLFLVEEKTWGLQFAIRTGSAKFSHEVLASTWSKMGWESKDGILYSTNEIRNDYGGKTTMEFYEEEDLFKFLNLPYLLPEEREL
ncbi:MAG: hypothetical protein B7X86_14440 [Sphingobacteriales bacterium 17-39-43]|uniref:hypothetical protein n=1 Tax=Daejeonella sp. TaxID=2805397 RepID=UPI000BC81E3E|nr:hypothetical protein [Daejeonella sp.]OYZ30146.1 MAG: hypothetical protein B7Y24_14205 [Sphingobacteriales bacterium 16-39-50]OZA22864.1 MAG: hypothetical protein B7X86_14440 [Sphingobacteriales bacterium 17-39-43]HQT23985.1 hypothetical protein [Daejeonella sp.]HQT58649.1 hypothetical protein [Daejeonella sp.]